MERYAVVEYTHFQGVLKYYVVVDILGKIGKIFFLLSSGNFITKWNNAGEENPLTAMMNVSLFPNPIVEGNVVQ